MDSLADINLSVSKAGHKVKYTVLKVLSSTGRTTKAKIHCAKHGTYVGAIPTKHVSCDKCRREQTAETRIANNLAAIVEGAKFLKYEILGSYSGSKTRIKVSCPKHGPFDAHPLALKNKKTACPECKAAERKSRRDTRIYAKYEKALGTYSDIQSSLMYPNVKVKCTKHNVTGVVSYASFCAKHPAFSVCPDCLREHRTKLFTKSQSQIEQQLQEKHSGRITLEDEYTGTRNLHTFSCNQCGHSWKTIPDSLVRTQASGCPFCNKTVSVAECELYEFVRSLCPDAQQSVRQVHSTKLGYKFEWDIFIPSLRIAIEFNGLYYHSFPRKPKWYHREKSLRSREAGVRLVHVYEDDWHYRKSVVEKTLRHLLGKTKTRYYARDLTLKYVDVLTDGVRSFYERNHMQGAPRRGETFALSTGRKIVAAMTFTTVQSERGKSDKVELIRFATTCSVVGGASKLFAAFRRKHQNVSVISYSDNDMFDGCLYSTLGFVKVKDIPEDYCTVWQKRRRHKSYTRRSNLRKLLGSSFNENVSEMKNLLNNHIPVIFNSGRVKWVYTVAPTSVLVLGPQPML